MSSKSRETPEQELLRLRTEMAEMTARISKLESDASKPKEPLPDDLTDEDLAVITAAVHTSPGGSAHIQAIRRRTSPSWAQQGRSFIQSLRNLRTKPRNHRQP